MDLLLLMAARENDAPKVAELLRAGAKTDVKVGIRSTSGCPTESQVLERSVMASEACMASSAMR